jgi:hypothetical protein
MQSRRTSDLLKIIFVLCTNLEYRFSRIVGWEGLFK